MNKHHQRRRARARGYPGPAGGYATWVETPAIYRGTSVQVCGLWPFGTGSATPTIGVPMGRHLITGNTICFDPQSWYTRTHLINTPSVFIVGEPGMGKSTAIRRMVLGMCAQGTIPLILGDLKPDYAALIKALGGQVIQVGPAGDRINPLDVGAWHTITATGRTADKIQANVIDRRTHMVSALITLIRNAPVTPDEASILTAAIRHGTATEPVAGKQLVLSDLIGIIRAAPPAIRTVTTFDDDFDRDAYDTDTLALQKSLRALVHGPLGSMVDGPTTMPIDLDTPAVCIDMSSLDDSDQLRTAACLLSAWSYGFALVDAAHLRTDLGLAPQRNFMVVLDEAWRALRAGHGLVDKVDILTRLNRNKGSSLVMASHGMADLEALPTEHDRAKAKGFADRSAVLMIGPSTEAELDKLSDVRPLSKAERTEVLSWTAPESWTGSHESVGRGNFLIKVGSRPGIPVHLVPTAIEKQLGNTDARFDMSGKAGAP